MRQAAALALDYEVDPHASGLATGKTMTIGLVAPLFGLWYADQVVVGAESVFSREGYDLLVTSVRDVDALELFLGRARSFGRRIDGALLIDLYAGGDQLDRLAALGVPAVSVGEDLGRWPSVSVDNQTAAAAATRHLLDLGHTRIGLIGGVQHNTLVAGARTSTAGLGFGARRGRSSGRSGAGLQRRIRGRRRRSGSVEASRTRRSPDRGVLHDRGLGALDEARRRGMDVPGDLCIVGFDDDDIAESVGLSTMRQPVALLGATAAELLLRLIAGDEPAEPAVDLPVELMVRDPVADALAERQRRRIQIRGR
ncbi:MAG: LacI family DNA-binding transcriptional regulator [Acidimicrobiales bacterium]